METSGFWDLGNVSDAQLRSGLGELLAAGYRTEARVIAHLAELEQRKLHLKDGSESLYRYCTVVLRLSNSEAFHRITAARVARKFPIVFSLLESRQLHLTAVCLLRDYLTLENHAELLAEACHKTKWQIEELLARRFPRPDVESRVRKLPAPRSAAMRLDPSPQSTPQSTLDLTFTPPIPSGTPECDAKSATNATAPDRQASSQPTAPSITHRAMPAPIQIKPLSEARYRIQLNASAALKEKLDRLRALTSHSNPSGDITVVIERALDIALAKVEKERFAKTARPRSTRRQSSQPKSGAPTSEHSVSADAASGFRRRRDHVPNAVRREIAVRDDMQCSYRGANGRRCTARAFLQVHHERPWARGGHETTENLRLLCGAPDGSPQNPSQLAVERSPKFAHAAAIAACGTRRIASLSKNSRPSLQCDRTRRERIVFA